MYPQFRRTDDVHGEPGLVVHIPGGKGARFQDVPDFGETVRRVGIPRPKMARLIMLEGESDAVALGLQIHRKKEHQQGKQCSQLPIFA